MTRSIVPTFDASDAVTASSSTSLTARIRIALSVMPVRARLVAAVHQTEVRVDLASRLRKIQRVKVQARHAGVEQIATELGGHLDPALADLRAIVAARLDPSNDVVGHRVSGQLRHPLHRDERRDRHDAREDRLAHTKGGHLLAQPLVLLELEEELRDSEVGELHLEGEMLAVRSEIGRLWMSGRMSGDADRLEPQPAPELDQLRRVFELLVRLLFRQRVAAEREQVL